jgi:hypothetical protein
VVYDDDPSDPPHHEFSSADRPQSRSQRPPTHSLYDLIAGVVKDLPREPPARLLAEALRRQRVYRCHLEYEITGGMILYVRRDLVSCVENS